MRLKFDNIATLWITAIFIVLPLFIASIKLHLSWELRFVAWLVMTMFLLMFFQYYVLQGGDNYGDSLLG